MGQAYHPIHSPIRNQPRIRFALLLVAGLLAGWLIPARPALGQAPAPQATAAESRVALVIGNSAYQNTPALPNPKRDAQAVGEALKRVGFDVDLRIDVTKATMDQALRRFGDRLEHAQVALFYYAGHGLQFNGVNYLVPIDAKLVKERDLNYEAVDLNQVLKEMEAERRVNLVFLDACRDNPLSRTLARSLGAKRALVGQGLAPVDAAVGTLISYATKDGAVAADGEGEHSPYTQAMLSYLERPGLEIGLLVRRVREDVMKATAGSQVPWDYGSLVGEFYFLPPALAAGSPPSLPAAPVTTVDAMAIELSFWDSIKSTSNPELLREYLSQYPQGKFAKIAKLRLADLDAERRKQDAAEKIAREATEREAALLREQASRRAAEEEARRVREAAERQLALQRPNDWATGQAAPMVRSRGSQISASDAQQFVQTYLMTLSRCNPSDIALMYGDTVDYFDKGLVTRQFILGDKRAYCQRWPEVSFTLTGPIKVIETGDEDSIVTFTTHFSVRSPSRGPISGRAQSTLKMRRLQGDIKILDEKQAVLARKKTS